MFLARTFRNLLAKSNTTLLSRPSSTTNNRQRVELLHEHIVRTVRTSNHRDPLTTANTDIVPIVLLGDSRLYEECTAVTSDTLTKKQTLLLARQLCATAAAWNAFGLAAPQIGHMVRMFVIVHDWKSAMKYSLTTPEDYQVYINPQVDAPCLLHKMVENEERCLSIPGFQGTVVRPDCINVSYVDGGTDHEVKTNAGEAKNGRRRNHKRIKKSFSSYQAAIFQHELDHLDGIVYLDRMDDIEQVVQHDD